MPALARTTTYRDEAKGVYRSAVHRQGRLVGALAIGAWDELNRVQEAVTARRFLWPWHWLRLRRTGQLWPERKAASIAEWPAAAVVCNCTGVTCGQLRAAQAAGCSTAAQLAARTGASTVCGACRPQLELLAGANGPAEPVGGASWLWITGWIGVVFAAALLLLPGLPYPATADVPWHWDALWRNSLYKQVSGFSLLGLMVVLALLSLRKRALPRKLAEKLGSFANWRVVHTVMGAIALGVLVVHSGGRFGDNLNLLLSACVVGAAGFGAVAGSALAREHTAAAPARRLQRIAFWVHLVLLWPLPVLLAFHVLKTYAF
jgi:nitrite reductase (NADH) large subunit